MSSLRKSSRISKEPESAGSPLSQQSRITEFVNVKKRAILGGTGKQVLLEAASELDSCPGTPVKIKRKPAGMGILTPCPSVESVTEAEVAVIKTVPVPVVIEAETETITSTTTSTTTAAALSTAATAPSPKAHSAPAYKRFAHLVESVRNQKPKLDLDEPISPLIESTAAPIPTTSFKAVPWLPLSEKWSFYEKLIFNVDSLCVLSAGRSQPCIFHKIQKTLENVLGKQVPLDQMERLRTLWPEAYEYRASRVVMQGKRVESVAIVVPGIGDAGSSAALMNERREEVKGRVQKHLIKVHNSEFGGTEAIPKQWSDKFEQATVSDLERTPLLGCQIQISEPPATPVRPGTPKLISEIIQSTPKPSKQSSPASTPSTPVNRDIAVTSPDAPVKLSLLERIRAKESALQSRKCFNGGDNPETARLSAILTQMEPFTQSVMFTFASSKKTSLFLSDLTAKLMQSSKMPLNQAEILERLKLLAKAAPEWIKIVENVEEGAPKHVKILEKSRSMQSVLDAIKNLKNVPQ